MKVTVNNITYEAESVEEIGDLMDLVSGVKKPEPFVVDHRMFVLKGVHDSFVLASYNHFVQYAKQHHPNNHYPVVLSVESIPQWYWDALK